MPTITQGEVHELAGLARLRLTDEEAERLRSDLGAILAYAERLAAVDTSGVEPMTHAVPLDCPLRDDLPAPSLPVEAALASAPRREGDCFVVPRVVDKGEP